MEIPKTSKPANQSNRAHFWKLAPSHFRTKQKSTKFTKNSFFQINSISKHAHIHTHTHSCTTKCTHIQVHAYNAYKLNIVGAHTHTHNPGTTNSHQKIIFVFNTEDLWQNIYLKFCQQDSFICWYVCGVRGCRLVVGKKMVSVHDLRWKSGEVWLSCDILPNWKRKKGRKKISVRLKTRWEGGIDLKPAFYQNRFLRRLS